MVETKAEHKPDVKATHSAKEASAKEASAVTSGAYDAMAGELTAGQTGWLTIDAAGAPVGPATLLPPPYGTPAIAVICGQNPPNPGFDVLTTLSGAPITASNQPSPDKRLSPEATPPGVLAAGATSKIAEKPAAKSA
jgi:hypothetical protein